MHFKSLGCLSEAVTLVVKLVGYTLVVTVESCLSLAYSSTDSLIVPFCVPLLGFQCRDQDQHEWYGWLHISFLLVIIKEVNHSTAIVTVNVWERPAARVSSDDDQEYHQCLSLRWKLVRWPCILCLFICLFFKCKIFISALILDFDRSRVVVSTDCNSIRFECWLYEFDIIEN